MKKCRFMRWNPFLIVTTHVKYRILNVIKGIGTSKTEFALVAALVTFIFPFDSRAQIQFKDVAEERGIKYSGRSYGASWGDFQGDGWPDLWTSNHGGTFPHLYLNNGDGTFTESVNEVWPNKISPDTHGAAWGDFDNDGDQDLLQLTGAGRGKGTVGRPSLFLVNRNGMFVSEASVRGLAHPFARGRTPLWLDWNNDGQLDVFEADAIRLEANSELFIQNMGLFTEFGLANYFASQTNNLFGQLKDLTGNGQLKLMLHRRRYPGKILALQSSSPQDLTEMLGLPYTSDVFDAVIEDLDGDLDNDIFLLRSNRDTSETIKTHTKTIKTYLQVFGNEKGISFSGGGSLTVQVGPDWNIKPEQIYIGTSGRHPSRRHFRVSPSDTGILSHRPGKVTGFFVGYNPATDTWELLYSSSNFRDVEIQVTATTLVSNLETIGFNPNAFKVPERFLMQTSNGFIDRTDAAGFGLPTGCQSGVAGDFDNDMDLDLYLVCRSQVNNTSNILYENLGNGTFQRVASAGGASGTSAGRGDSATVVDFDRDGFLDIFVTNGWGHFLFSNGPYQLFRNQGNDNHWIEFDLQGVLSNRDAIGAKVFLTAGGKTQVREQSGGMHNESQNHQRIHFGLGQNTVIDKVVIHWPSGQAQILANLVVEEIHTITEASMGEIDPEGKPNYNPNVDESIFLWRENDGSWRLRATAGGKRTSYVGTMTADRPFSYVTPYLLESDDSLDNSDPNLVLFDIGMFNGWSDGIDFAFPAGANVCVAIDSPKNATVLIGATRTPVTTHFNLTDFGPCDPTGPAIDPDGAPNFDPNIDEAIFLWREPDDSWRLRATAGGGLANYIGTMTTDQSFSYVTPYLLESRDTLDKGNPNAVLFDIRMAKGWQDGIDFSFPTGANVCFDLAAPGDAKIYVGTDRALVNTPFNLTDLTSCN